MSDTGASLRWKTGIFSSGCTISRSSARRNKNYKNFLKQQYFPYINKILENTTKNSLAYRYHSNTMNDVIHHPDRFYTQKPQGKHTLYCHDYSRQSPEIFLMPTIRLLDKPEKPCHDIFQKTGKTDFFPTS